MEGGHPGSPVPRPGWEGEKEQEVETLAFIRTQQDPSRARKTNLRQERVHQKFLSSWAWWRTPVIAALWEADDREFEASPSYLRTATLFQKLK